MSVFTATSGQQVAYNSTTTTVTPPEGIANGDLVLLFISKDGAEAFTTPEGWTFLRGRGDTANYLAVFYKIATGAIEAFNVAHPSERTSWICVAITNASDPVASDFTTHVENPNPGSLSSGYDAGTTTTWFGVIGWDNNNWLTAYPEGYADNRLTVTPGHYAGAGIAIASKTNTEASDDPGAFTLNASTWSQAGTIAVKNLGEAAPAGTSSRRRRNRRMLADCM
jgi:archaellum component FlaG (FlaF/FlaG flagellin family)